MNKQKLFFTTVFLIVLIASLPLASAYTLSYDANGNLITGDGKFRIYDGFNHLVQVRNGSDSSGLIMENYTWHPVEDRILVKAVYETNGSWKENVYYFSKEFVRVKNATGKFDYKYIYQNGQFVAQQNPDGSKLFFHNDNLGSVGLITNESGTKVEETFYSPFGEILSGGETSRYDYTGKEFDSITGDYDFNARKLGTKPPGFTTPDLTIPDVYNPQTLNRYSYANNNPYAYTDPSGKAAVWIHGVDTFRNYLIASIVTGHIKEGVGIAYTMAINAMEPDIYRYKDSKNVQIISNMAGLDLKLEHSDNSEDYYHDDKPSITTRESEFWDAVSQGRINKMGNLEHPLGHDVGSNGVEGYHSASNSWQNSISIPWKDTQIRPIHIWNDISSILTNRNALNLQQLSRAVQAMSQLGGGSSTRTTGRIVSYSYSRINCPGGYTWSERIETRN